MGCEITEVTAKFTVNGSTATFVESRNGWIRLDASASTPSGVTYNWDFGDGTTLSTTSPTTYHQLPQLRNAYEYYEVVLTISANGSVSSRGVLVEVACSSYVPGGPECMR